MGKPSRGPNSPGGALQLDVPDRALVRILRVRRPKRRQTGGLVRGMPFSIDKSELERYASKLDQGEAADLRGALARAVAVEIGHRRPRGREAGRRSPRSGRAS